MSKLENLFVSAIHPSVLKKLGQSDADEHRRTVDDKLQKSAKELASKHGMYQEMLDELAWKSDYSKNGEEWNLLQQQKDTPNSRRRLERFAQQVKSPADFQVDLGDIEFSKYTTPVVRERHIGTDQGLKNFAIAAVEGTLGEYPIIVDMKHYSNLGLKD